MKKFLKKTASAVVKTASLPSGGVAILNAAEEAREGADSLVAGDIIDLSALNRIDQATSVTRAGVMPVIGSQDAQMAREVVAQTWPLVQANISTVRAVAEHSLAHRPDALARTLRALDEAEDAYRTAVRAHNTALEPLAGPLMGPMATAG